MKTDSKVEIPLLINKQLQILNKHLKQNQVYKHYKIQTCKLKFLIYK